MKCIAVKLKPKTSFHIGEREEWREGSKIYFPADTLFSALTHCYLLLYGNVNAFLEEFLSGQPPFLLSSAFPFWGEDYYFPLPKNKFLSPQEVCNLKEISHPNDKKDYEIKKLEKAVPLSLKEIKKTQFVNLASLRFLLNGQSLYALILKSAEDHKYKTLPLLFFPGEDKEKFADCWKKKPWTVENVPRLALSRLSSHPGENFFNFGRVYYAADAGLFVLVKVNQPNWETKLRSLFYLLAHEGVGGDRTIGQGLFETPEFHELELPDINDGQWLYCLSPYFPNDDERRGLADGYYEIEERKGYIFSPGGRSLRRRSIRVFTEGSIFPLNLDRRGRLVDLTPDLFKAHRVYRYGLLFGLPCRLEERRNEN